MTQPIETTVIDSEAVEAALIKGYSSKSDLCDLISVFWDLVRRHQKIPIKRAMKRLIEINRADRRTGMAYALCTSPAQLRFAQHG